MAGGRANSSKTSKSSTSTTKRKIKAAEKEDDRIDIVGMSNMQNSVRTSGEHDSDDDDAEGDDDEDDNEVSIFLCSSRKSGTRFYCLKKSEQPQLHEELLADKFEEDGGENFRGISKITTKAEVWQAAEFNGVILSKSGFHICLKGGPANHRLAVDKGTHLWFYNRLALPIDYANTHPKQATVYREMNRAARNALNSISQWFSKGWGKNGASKKPGISVYSL